MSRISEITNGKVVGVSTPTTIVPEPEFLTRNDTDYGRWTVRGCEATAGIPSTQVDTRSMFAPLYDDELSRHIRAHEMFHAKVSPTEQQMTKIWRKRGYASDRTLHACEELRVNTLMKNAGFEPETFMKSGSETHDGTVLATHGDFQNAVLYAVSVCRTAGWQDFLNGVAPIRPEWIEALTKFTTEACNFYDHVVERNQDDNFYNAMPLHATGVKAQDNGFAWTEALAKWVETLVDAKQDKAGQPKEGEEGEEGEGKQGKKGENLSEGLEKAGEDLRDTYWHKGNLPKRGKDHLWEKLIISKPMLDKSVMGAIGRKKVASQTGKNPRRISRLLSDPERRIFDRSVKGAGGVVLIDTSGSMSLSPNEVTEMVLNAPSALVAMYSGGSRTNPNLWVIANKGRMCSKLPRPNGGNGVDGEALRWAIKQRQRTNSPVIWVSDGGVTGHYQANSDDLMLDCVKLCKQHGVYVVPDAPTAIALLKKLKAREKVTSVVPEHLAEHYYTVTQTELVLR